MPRKGRPGGGLHKPSSCSKEVGPHKALRLELVRVEVIPLATPQGASIEVS